MSTVRHTEERRMPKDKDPGHELMVVNTDLGACGKRLDSWLSESYEDLSRSYIQKLIRSGHININGKPMKAGKKLSGNEAISIELPPPVTADILPEDIPLDIVYEDDDILIVNKPKDMVVHPAPGHASGTLVNALMYHCGASLSGINGVQRPGIVHRIDRDTTGLLVVCKNDASHAAIAAQLAEHSISRRYVALVIGCPKTDEGVVDAPIGRSRNNRMKMAVDHVNGKTAVTHYRVIEKFSGYSLVECRLETGRTHQIRVHMSYIGHPVAGDPLYASSGQTLRIRVLENGCARTCPIQLKGQALHARLLGLIHPSSGEYMEWEAPLPQYFEELLSLLRAH